MRDDSSFFISLVLKGFTTIELLVVLGITVLLASGAVSLMRLTTSSQLNDASSEIMQFMRLASSRARSGLGDSDHGVYFNIDSSGADEAILYRGLSYSTRNSAYDRSIRFAPSLIFSTSFPGNDAIFINGAGTPVAEGEIIIVHSSGSVRKIIINSAGAVEEQ